MLVEMFKESPIIFMIIVSIICSSVVGVLSIEPESRITISECKLLMTDPPKAGTFKVGTIDGSEGSLITIRECEELIKNTKNKCLDS